jgi:hypothetical protein
MTSIAQLSDVRSEGALITPSGSNGAPTDEQVQAALNGGQLLMLKRFETAEYAAVRDYAGSDPDELEKKDRFLHAESCFAVSALPRILTNTQLAKTGLVKTKRVGDASETFASGVETNDITGDWIAKAYDWLSKYLGNKVLDEDGKQIGYRSKDRKLTIVAI